MNQKKCPYCNNNKCIKKGKQKGHQRWQCKYCKKKFQANKKALLSKEELFCLYTFSKQTLSELSQTHSLKTKTIQKLFDKIVLPIKVHTPRNLSLAVDTTFFDNFAVVVFRDQKNKECLWWKFTDKEALQYYYEGKLYLERLGYTFRSITGDGLPGLPSVFHGIPFQYCHFHAKQTIRRYITKNPQTKAGIELKFIMDNLENYTHKRFLKDITNWDLKYDGFLKERTYHPGGTWSYTHGRLRGAVRSMKRMSEYLFTYQKHLFFIPVTTNTLEGFFSHLKVRVGAHRGICTIRKQKLIVLILLNSSSIFKKDMWKKLF
jgi:hypothetical protein